MVGLGSWEVKEFGGERDAKGALSLMFGVTGVSVAFLGSGGVLGCWWGCFGLLSRGFWVGEASICVWVKRCVLFSESPG